MCTTGMETRTVQGDLLRYLNEYGWGWGLAHKLINRWYGTDYTIPELKLLYHAPETLQA